MEFADFLDKGLSPSLGMLSVLRGLSMSRWLMEGFLNEYRLARREGQGIRNRRGLSRERERVKKN